MIVPDTCLPLLRKQRTHYRDPAREYGEELQQTFETFRHLLPAKADRILDIGCGMAGIDVLLSEHYGHEVDLCLADKQGESEKIWFGFKLDASYYHDFGEATDLLLTNGVHPSRINVVDLNCSPFPSGPFDIVISLLSWGFHYPIETYAPNVKPGGVIIADIRKNTDGEDRLRAYGTAQRVFTQRKLKRGQYAQHLETTWGAARSPYTRAVVRCE